MAARSDTKGRNYRTKAVSVVETAFAVSVSVDLNFSIF